METHFLKVNAEAVAIYNQLYELFPMDYVVNERPHKVDYVIRARFRSKAEWEEKRAKLEDIYQHILRLGYLNRYTNDQTEEGRRLHRVTMDLPCELYDQNDYLQFTWDEQRVEFGYYANNRPKYAPTQQSCQQIADEVDRVFKTYTKRKEARSKAVEYEGDRYRTYTFNGVDANRFYSAGTRYVIPDCSAEDYQKLADLFRGYSFRHNLSVLYSGIYGEYEQIGLCCSLNNGKTVCFGVALKGTDLYLVRTESRVDEAGLLPRAWAEDDPVWRLAQNSLPFFSY